MKTKLMVVGAAGRIGEYYFSAGTPKQPEVKKD
jgi:hypothetical protein